MTTTTKFNKNDFYQAITKAVSQHVADKVNEIVEDAAEKAKRRIMAEVRKSAAQLALNLLSEYNIRYDQQNLIITVRDARNS